MGDQIVWATWTLGQRYVAPRILGANYLALSLTALFYHFVFLHTACPARNQRDGLKRSRTTASKPRGTAGTADTTGAECFKCGETGHYSKGEWWSGDVAHPSPRANFNPIRLP
jgi:hypothetical protein